jgi:ABC-type multidrug transport system fused ATPase/permease subunit
LVGASGSGKSTLATLLLRLREPTAGRIVVDNTDYWDFTAESWHKGLGIVEQEAFLFNDTIRHNIRFGCPEATETQVLEAARIAHLNDVLKEQSQGLDTVVGERGTMLSGGQRQRMTIARAVLRNPHLLLLDEATSALDNHSERQVQAALDEARKGRTTIVIAHRLTTIRNADLIVVLDQGRVVETGTWESLEQQSGAFSRLLAAAKSVDSDDTPLTKSLR